jgi:hypothetical protein
MIFIKMEVTQFYIEGIIFLYSSIQLNILYDIYDYREFSLIYCHNVILIIQDHSFQDHDVKHLDKLHIKVLMSLIKCCIIIQVCS